MPSNEKFTFARAGIEGVTASGKVKTWTFSPQISVTVSARAGIAIALRLLLDSTKALIRRDSVTFYAGGEPIAHTYEMTLDQ